MDSRLRGNDEKNGNDGGLIFWNDGSAMFSLLLTY
jgi:hypothetical protein